MPDSQTDIAAACADLSESLWRTRELLDVLAYRIEVQRALVETARSGWLARSTREVDDTIATIRSSELARSVDLLPLTEALGLPPQASLRELTEAVPAPWDQVLAEHRHALGEATAALLQAASPTASCSPRARRPSRRRSRASTGRRRLHLHRHRTA